VPLSQLVAAAKTFVKHEVTLYVAVTVFKEQVVARDYQEAKQVALARNPNARVVSVTAKFN
jgi:hypothetical protein